MSYCPRLTFRGAVYFYISPHHEESQRVPKIITRITKTSRRVYIKIAFGSP